MTFGVGELAGAIVAMITIERMKMERNEVHRGADAAGLQFFDNAVAIDAEEIGVYLQYVEVPGVIDVRRDGWGREGVQRGKALRVAGSERGAACE